MEYSNSFDWAENRKLDGKGNRQELKTGMDMGTGMSKKSCMSRDDLELTVILFTNRTKEEGLTVV